MFRRLQGLARSPEELPGESGRAKPSSLQKAQKSASGEGRGPKKYCKTYDICNMDLKNRAHSHVLAPQTKSTAPKHGSVGIFQKLGARGGKFPGTSTIFRSKKVGPPCTSAIVNVTIPRCPVVRLRPTQIQAFYSRAGLQEGTRWQSTTPSNYYYYQ